MDNSPFREELLERARALRQQGELIAAKDIYSELLEKNQTDSQVRYFLGMTLWLLGERSMARHQIAVAIKQGYCEDSVLFNYGLLLQELCEYTAAAKAYTEALVINPLLEDGNNNLGLALNELGENDKAFRAFQQELVNYPNNVSALNNLANLLRAKKEDIEAANLLEQAIKINPDFADAHNNIGNIYWDQGQGEKALLAYKRAVEICPGNILFRQGFCKAISEFKIDHLDNDYIKIISDCFDTNGLDYQLLIYPSLRHLNDEPEIQALYCAAGYGKHELLQFLLERGAKIFSEPLLSAVLRKGVVNSPKMEKLLTMLRGICLSELINGNKQFLGEQQEMLLSIANQCFNNEYVFFVTDEEKQQLESVVSSLESDFEEGNFDIAASATELLIISTYIPLYQLEMARRLLSIKEVFSEAMQQVLVMQIAEVQQEFKSVEKIQRITEIDDSSLKVMAINEDAPYPRWLSINMDVSNSTYIKCFKKKFPERIPPVFAEEKTNILVAGCGTGKHAILVAQQFSDSDVLGIDLSQRSLAYASRMSERLGIENIHYAQADILGLRDYDEKFHHIDCFGVLHHFHDKAEGLNCLVSTLSANGTIRLGLYSTIARRFTEKLRQFVREQGYTEDISGIRQARKDILEGRGGKGIIVATKFKDFYTVSECRYLLFSAQDNSSSLIEIGQMLDSCGLEFLGFSFKDKQVFSRYVERFPKDESMKNLANWEIFEKENPDTFIECYDFWCQKHEV